MNIEYLKLFVRVAHLTNITKAGAEFGLSSTVASTHLNKLEESLNVRLLHRTTRKVSLTEEGSAFLPHAQEILAAIDYATSTLGGSTPTPKGTLRITAPSSFGRFHLMPFIDRFMESNPELDVELHLSDSMVDLIEGGFDLAVRNAELKDSSLIAKKLATDQRIIVASPNYIKKYGLPETPVELKNHQCINLFGNTQWVFKSDNGNIQVKTSGAFKTNDGEAVLDACIKGMGVVMTANWMAYKALKRGDVVRVLSDYPLVSDAAVWAVYPTTKLLAPKVRAFIDFFAEQYSNPPYWDKY